MYAVIQTGGKQYKVAPGDLLRIEKLNGEVGDQITFESVLFVGSDTQSQVGAPLVPGATVTGTILDHLRGSKVVVLKFKRRKMYRRKSGHRQSLTSIRIDEINAPQVPKKAAPKKAAPKKAAPKKAAPKKAAPKKAAPKKAAPKKAAPKKAAPKKAAPKKAAPKKAISGEPLPKLTGKAAGSLGETDSGSDQSTKSKE